MKTINGKTELIVDMDITDDYKDYFEKTWPKALTKVKELAEKNKKLEQRMQKIEGSKM